jgi:hypothetical protein
MRQKEGFDPVVKGLRVFKTVQLHGANSLTWPPTTVSIRALSH